MEHWQHLDGCRGWLLVRRNPSTGAVLETRLLGGAADMNGMRRGTRVEAGRVRFRFDGRVYEGQPGDTAASALLASGVRYFGRSVKYRRLRGVLADGPEEPNALLTVGTPPAVDPQRSGTDAAC